MTPSKPTLPEDKWAALPDLAALGTATLQEGRFSVTVDEGRFEACYWPKPGSKRLYVLLSGARDLRTRSWPNFDRWSWSQLFPGSVLCVADPTLALDTDKLRIGWYVGTAERDWTQGLADLIRLIADKAGIATRDVVCYGSSAGGFGALALASRLGDAIAVAINPQTNVLKYHARPVRQFLRTAFPGRDRAKLGAAQRRRLSAVEAVLAAPDVRCLLVQNRQDLHHYREHFLPLAQRVGVDTQESSRRHDRIWTLMYDGNARHGPEPKSMAPEIIATAEALCRHAGGTDTAGLANPAGAAGLARATAPAGNGAQTALSVDTEAHARSVSARANMPGAAEYAFYLYQDSARIAVQKYSQADRAEWPTVDTARHRYRVKVYARRPDGTTVTAYAPVPELVRPDTPKTRRR